MNKKKVTTNKGRRESRVYVHERTNFSTDQTMLSLQEHKQLQRDHGTLSGKLMSHKQVLTGMSRIMMSYLQVVAIARAVPIQWPKEVIAVLDAFATVSAPSLSLVSVDCALGGQLAEQLQSQAAEQAGLDGTVGLSMIFQKFIMVMLVRSCSPTLDDILSPFGRPLTHQFSNIVYFTFNIFLAASVCGVDSYCILDSLLRCGRVLFESSKKKIQRRWCLHDQHPRRTFRCQDWMWEMFSLGA